MLPFNDSIIFSYNFDNSIDDDEDELYKFPGESIHGIGIDLGTTYSSAGVMHNDRVEIIQNDQDNISKPYYATFTADRRLIEDAAKNQNMFIVSILFNDFNKKTIKGNDKIY